MGEALDAIADGSARALGVMGEPGIGKTRVLRELGVLAERRGYLVLSGRAAEFDPEFRSSRWFRARSVGENVVFMGVFGVFEAAGVDLA